MAYYSTKEYTENDKSDAALRRIFVHIGHVKTGTSALQHFFSQNRTLLKKEGVLYPETGLYGPGHHKIPVGMVKREEIEDFLTFFEKRNYRQCFFEEGLSKCLISEIESSQCNKVFISSEYFMFMRDLSALKRLLRPFKVSIILTLRRQDMLLESFYRQVLLVGYSKGIIRFLHRYRQLLFDYREIIERWSKAFGLDALRVYDYGTWTREVNIYESIMDIVRVAYTADLKIPQEPDMTNKKMDAGFAALLRISNMIGISKQFSGSLPEHLRVMQDSFGAGYLGRGTFLSPKASLKLLEDFSEDNRWVEKTFLHGASSLTNLANITKRKYSGFNIFRALKILLLASKRQHRENRIYSIKQSE